MIIYSCRVYLKSQREDVRNWRLTKQTVTAESLDEAVKKIARWWSEAYGMTVEVELIDEWPVQTRKGKR